MQKKTLHLSILNAVSLPIIFSWLMSSIIRSKSLCIVHLVPKRLVSCLISFWCQQKLSHHIGLTIIILLLTLIIRFTSLFWIQFYTFSTLPVLTFNHVHRPPERTCIGICSSWLHLWHFIGSGLAWGLSLFWLSMLGIAWVLFYHSQSQQ